MNSKKSALSSWTPEQVANGQRWVQAWRDASPVLEAIRKRELRELDSERALELLCGPADYTVPPRAPKPHIGPYRAATLVYEGQTL